jgi:hypothetical protein
MTTDTETVVDIEILAQEASNHWAPWSERIQAMKREADTSLRPQDFSLIDGAQDVYSAFIDAQTRLETFLGGGVKAFDAFKETLKDTCVEYLEEEGASAAEVAAFKAKYSL